MQHAISQDFIEAVRRYRECNGNNHTPLTREAVNHARDCSLALYQEVAELVDSFQWKPWRPGIAVDVPNFRREVVDILHFIIHIADMLGIDLLAVEQQHTVNWVLAHNLERLQNGYNISGETNEGSVIQGHDR